MRLARGVGDWATAWRRVQAASVETRGAGPAVRAARLLYPQVLRLPAAVVADAGGPVVTEPFVDHGHARSWLRSELPNLVAAIVHTGQHGPRLDLGDDAQPLLHFVEHPLAQVVWHDPARTVRGRAVRRLRISE